jgi:hypothetical protein
VLHFGSTCDNTQEMKWCATLSPQSTVHRAQQSRSTQQLVLKQTEWKWEAPVD